jgi:hypothetical protein
MKKNLNLLYTLSMFAIMALFTSCGTTDDETPAPAAPTLNVTLSGSAKTTGSTITAVPGDSLVVNWSANTPGGFNTFVVKQGTSRIVDLSRTSLGVAAGTTSVTGLPFAIKFTNANIGTFDIEFLVVDDLNQESKNTYTVTVSSQAARSYTAVLLFAPLESKAAASFFSTSTGKTHSPTSVTTTAGAISPTIDFGYYYGASDNATLASPLAYSTLPVAVFKDQVAGWNKLNTTIWKRTTLNSAKFLESTSWSKIDDAYAAGTAVNGGVVTKLAVGQVIAFQTDATKTGGAKKGLILVKAITGTFNQNDKIELEILVQEPAQ